MQASIVEKIIYIFIPFIIAIVVLVMSKDIKMHLRWMFFRYPDLNRYEYIFAHTVFWLFVASGSALFIMLIEGLSS